VLPRPAQSHTHTHTHNHTHTHTHNYNHTHPQTTTLKHTHTHILTHLLHQVMCAKKHSLREEIMQIIEDKIYSPNASQ
jgi:hypothetical protein